jgi:hypothetical protein
MKGEAASFIKKIDRTKTSQRSSNERGGNGKESSETLSN